MTSPQEVRIAKIGVVIAFLGVVIAFLTWVHPFAPRSDASGTGKTAASSEPPAQPTQVTEGVSGAGLTSGGEGGASPHTDRLNSARPPRACDAPEIATVRPGAPAKVVSGLAVLSVKTAREGSEPYLTLGIASDRVTLAKAVLGAPVRYRFATSLGAYFVNVTDVDLAAGTMTVQVGCEEKESTP